MSISIPPLTRVHIIGIGVTVFVATAVCVGVLVSYSVGLKSSVKTSPLLSSYKDKLVSIDHAFQWKRFTWENVTLDGAFEAGKNKEGKPIYICRGIVSNDLSPGTYDSAENICYVSYGSRALSLSTFDILFTKNPSALIWLASSNAEFYNGAISAGFTYTKDELQISRFDFGTFQKVGKVHDRYSSAYAPLNGGEHEDTKDYHVLHITDYSL